MTDGEAFRRSNYPLTPMVLHHRPRSVLWPLSTGFSKDTQCDQPKRFISQCAFPAPDPSPLLFKAIKQTAVDYTLHSKPWAGHLVKGRHSIDKVHDLKELRTWWGNRKSSIHHTFTQLTFIGHILYNSYQWTCSGFKNKQDTAESTVQGRR